MALKSLHQCNTKKKKKPYQQSAAPCFVSLSVSCCKDAGQLVVPPVLMSIYINITYFKRSTFQKCPQ